MSWRKIGITGMILIAAGLGSATHVGHLKHCLLPAAEAKAIVPQTADWSVPCETRAPRTLDSIGTAYRAGTTWYDAQHIGSGGRTIFIDEMGHGHVVWTREWATGAVRRHAYYNLWDAFSGQFVIHGHESGTVIDAARIASHVCVAGLPSGWIFPAYQALSSNDSIIRVCVGIDLMSGMGFFNSTPIPSGNIGLQAPKIAVGSDSILHLVSTEVPAGNPFSGMRLFYSRAHPIWDADGLGVQVVFDFVDGTSYLKTLDTVAVMGSEIAVSRDGQRVAIVWPSPRGAMENFYNNDLCLALSEDGGMNWLPVRNITNFAYPDYDCVSQDTLLCDRDTFRVFMDCSAVFDDTDELHVAFTTRYYYELERLFHQIYSDIWHWGEVSDVFSNIVRGRFEYAAGDTALWTDAGTYQSVVQRPSLAADDVTGYLYCAYQFYDSAQVSAAGLPQSDGFISRSVDGGMTWSVGTNITESDGGVNTPAGECRSERDITLAEYVTRVDGEAYLHMFFELDRDAGTALLDPSAATENAMIYQRIPVDDIPIGPRNPWWLLNLHADSTQMPNIADEVELACAAPHELELKASYPNPFNSVSQIRFRLMRDTRVAVDVFDILGRQVATLADGIAFTAGEHEVSLDASRLSSGIYLCRVSTDHSALTQKLVLMK